MIIQGKEVQIKDLNQGDIFSMSSEIETGEKNYLNIIVPESLKISKGENTPFNVISLDDGRVRTFHPETYVYLYDKTQIFR